MESHATTASLADLEIRIFAPRMEGGPPVELTLRGERQFCGYLDPMVLSWASTLIPLPIGSGSLRMY